MDQRGDDDEITGQLLVKVCVFGARYTRQTYLAQSLLSILRHRAVEKTVEKCEMSIVEGGGSDVEEDGLESRLVVVLHCKHGLLNAISRQIYINCIPRCYKDASTPTFYTKLSDGSWCPRYIHRVFPDSRTKSHQGHGRTFPACERK